MMRPPSYVRAANFTNQSSKEVTIIAHFQSGETQNFQIPLLSNMNVEREINHGSYTTVDPISKIEANHVSTLFQTLEFQPEGIEIHEYVIKDEGESLRIEKI